jgi:hypothetical protein
MAHELLRLKLDGLCNLVCGAEPGGNIEGVAQIVIFEGTQSLHNHIIGHKRKEPITLQAISCAAHMGPLAMRHAMALYWRHIYHTPGQDCYVFAPI